MLLQESPSRMSSKRNIGLATLRKLHYACIKTAFSGCWPHFIGTNWRSSSSKRQTWHLRSLYIGKFHLKFPVKDLIDFLFSYLVPQYPRPKDFSSIFQWKRLKSLNPWKMSPKHFYHSHGLKKERIWTKPTWINWNTDCFCKNMIFKIHSQNHRRNFNYRMITLSSIFNFTCILGGIFVAILVVYKKYKWATKMMQERSSSVATNSVEPEKSFSLSTIRGTIDDSVMSMY